MTKKSLLIIIIILITVFSTKLSLADVILPGQKVIISCIKIDNLSSFPEIDLIAVEKEPLIEEPEGYHIYKITEGQCLKYQYKMNKISIFWNNKENLKLEENNLLLKDINIGFRTIDENDPLIKEEIIYSLVKTKNGEIKLYKSKEIKKYSNKKDEVIIYSNPFKSKIIITEFLEPTKIINPTIISSEKTVSFKKEQNFFFKIFCLFKKLFGLRCE